MIYEYLLTCGLYFNFVQAYGICKLLVIAIDLLYFGKEFLKNLIWTLLKISLLIFMGNTRNVLCN